jgi:regulatory protein
VKISAIKPQKKNKNRCSIFIDGEYRFGLSNEIVIKHDLHEGDEIYEEDISGILLQEEREKVRNRAYRILQYRERSAHELSIRLVDIGFDKPLVDDVISGFIADDILNDHRFAEAFVHDYTKLKPRGNRFIYHELLKRGVDKKTVEAVLAGRDERVLIEEFLTNKVRGYTLQKRKDRQKVVRQLLNRGFSSELVYDIIREYSKEDM